MICGCGHYNGLFEYNGFVKICKNTDINTENKNSSNDIKKVQNKSKKKNNQKIKI